MIRLQRMTSSAQVLPGSPLQSAPRVQVLCLLPGSGYRRTGFRGEGGARRHTARPRVSGQNGGGNDDDDDEDDDVIVMC